MPCTDGGVPYAPTRYEVLTDKMPAALCALLRVMTVHERETLFERADWTKAGVSVAEIREWWREHQKRDQARQNAEDLQRELERARQSGLAKLSPTERHALGL